MSFSHIVIFSLRKERPVVSLISFTLCLLFILFNITLYLSLMISKTVAYLGKLSHQILVLTAYEQTSILNTLADLSKCLKVEV